MFEVRGLKILGRVDTKKNNFMQFERHFALNTGISFIWLNTGKGAFTQGNRGTNAKLYGEHEKNTILWNREHKSIFDWGIRGTSQFYFRGTREQVFSII